MFLSAAARRILAYNEPVDMRKSFNGLVALVQGVLQEDPLSGSLFVFFNRRRDRVKILVWDRNGFWLHYKRLERGVFQSWIPKGAGSTHVEIDRARLTMLLEGIDVRNAKYRRHFASPIRIGSSQNGRDHERTQATG